MEKMKIEIWSDVVCPWCYIGKRRLEDALSKFEFGEYIDIEWKSYQLDPNAVTDPNKNALQALADKKGISFEQAVAMGNQVTAVAKTVGLDYHFDKTIPVNTKKAHRFLHFAKANNKQNEAKEMLLSAFFTQGLNLDENQNLSELGQKIGLNSAEIGNMLLTNQYRNQVDADILEAEELGLRGVPFFVFDRKYGISGAQEVEVFAQTLQKSFKEWLSHHPTHNLNITDGNI